MGLDITAYKNLTPVSQPPMDKWGEEPIEYNRYFRPGRGMEWAEEHFPGRAEGLSATQWYEIDDRFGFRAGSYSGYNQWRNQLANIAGYSFEDIYTERVTEGPFFELVCFADNEGVIGPVVAKKLAQDFAEHLDKAESAGGYFLEKYHDWMKACEMASQAGAIDFH